MPVFASSLRLSAYLYESRSSHLSFHSFIAFSLKRTFSQRDHIILWTWYWYCDQTHHDRMPSCLCFSRWGNAFSLRNTRIVCQSTKQVSWTKIVITYTSHDANTFRFRIGPSRAIKHLNSILTTMLVLNIPRAHWSMGVNEASNTGQGANRSRLLKQEVTLSTRMNWPSLHKKATA